MLKFTLREMRAVGAPERRFLGAQVRSEDAEGKQFIRGYAATFNTLSENLGGWREKIDPGAFDQSLRSGADVQCSFNHDLNLLLGRTSNGTLSVSTDTRGLSFRCQIPEGTRAGQDLLIYLKRGDVKECSFAFSCDADSWGDEKDPVTGNPIGVRTLRAVSLYELGPVVSPAYPATSVALDDVRMRAMFPATGGGVPIEIRSRVGVNGSSAAVNRERGLKILQLDL